MAKTRDRRLMDKKMRRKNRQVRAQQESRSMSMMETINSISQDTVKLMGFYHSLKNHYDDCMAYVNKKVETDPTPDNQRMKEKYKAMGAEFATMKQMVENIIRTTADLESSSDPRDKATYFFEHMNELQDAPVQMSEIFNKLASLNKEFMVSPSSAVPAEEVLDASEATFDESVENATVVSQETPTDTKPITPLINA